MHMMMRAQNETCSSRCGSDGTIPAPEKVLEYMMKNNGWNRRSESIQISPQSHSTDSRSDSLAPLNLSVGPTLSPGQVYKGLTCVKCGETVPDEEALALHLMEHVRETTERPYYQRQNSISRFTKGLLPTLRSARTEQGSGRRPDSVPIEDKPKTIPLSTNGRWTCHICTKACESCDILAMHMIDAHTLANGDDDHINHNKSLDNKNTKDTDQSLDTNTINHPSTPSIMEELECDKIPREMPAEQTSYSARSTPLATKRMAEDEAESPQPKRCKSVDSSMFICSYCNKHFSNQKDKDSHVVDDHGLSLREPHCLICCIPFRTPDALKAHLECPAHDVMKNIQKTTCQHCEFVASSSAQIREHKLLHGRIPDQDLTGQTAREGLIHELLKESQKHEVHLNNTKQSQPDENKEGGELKIDECDNKESKEGTEAVDENPKETKEDTAMNTLSGLSRRSKRKPRISAKFIRGLVSPSISDNDNWMDETSSLLLPTLHPLRRSASPRHNPLMPMAIDASNPLSMVMSTTCTPSMWPNLHSKFKPPHSFVEQQQQQHQQQQQPQPQDSFQKPPSTNTGTSGLGLTAHHDEGSDVDLIDYVLSNSEKLVMCKYCKIIFTDQTMYYLHMGLHNLNDPWQCNLCGKANRNVHEFTSHVIHY